MKSPRKRVVLLGATGSIGENTLRVITAHPDKLELVGIAARTGWEKLLRAQLDARTHPCNLANLRPRLRER